MVWKKLIGQYKNTRIVAVFDTQVQLNDFIQLLQTEGLQATQLHQIAPYEKGYDIVLEPARQSMAHTLIGPHALLGSAGFLGGLLLWLILYYAGVSPVAGAPLPSAIALLFFMTVGGLMLGGMVTQDPDPHRVLEQVRSATAQGKWALIIHPHNTTQGDAMTELLAASGVDAKSGV